MKLKIYKADTTSDLTIPLVSDSIRAGFPSPAEDYMEGIIDLNRELIQNPATTFLARVTGSSMREESIDEGDILVVDKSLAFMNHDLAVCYLNGEFTLKRVRQETDAFYLVPANPEYKEIKVTEGNDFIIWGIVTYVIKATRRPRVF